MTEIEDLSQERRERLQFNLKKRTVPRLHPESRFIQRGAVDEKLLYDEMRHQMTKGIPEYEPGTCVKCYNQRVNLACQTVQEYLMAGFSTTEVTEFHRLDYIMCQKCTK
jgi:hypothetical protein